MHRLGRSGVGFGKFHIRSRVVCDVEKQQPLATLEEEWHHNKHSKGRGAASKRLVFKVYLFPLDFSFILKLVKYLFI